MIAPFRRVGDALFFHVRPVALSCLGCQSSRIHHGSIGSVRTHTTATRAANPTASSKKTIQPPVGTLPQRAHLAQVEPGLRRGEARGGGGLGQREMAMMMAGRPRGAGRSANPKFPRRVAMLLRLMIRLRLKPEQLTEKEFNRIIKLRAQA